MSEVKVVVEGQPDPEPEPDEVEFESQGACYEDMSDEDKAAVVKAVGSLEKVKANPALNDC